MFQKVANWSQKMPRLASLAALGAVALIALSARPASAQIQVKDLLDNSVDNITPEMGKEIEAAIASFTSGQFADARNALIKARTKYTQLPPAGVLMAQMFVAANQGAAARIELEKTVLDTPDDPEAFLVFGDLAFQNRMITESGLCFEKAAALVPAYNANAKRKRNLTIRSYAGLAAVAEAREQYDKAEQLLKKWIEIEPDSTAAYTRLGRAQFKQGEARHKDAYATFRKLYEEIDKEKDPTKKVARPEVNMALMYTQENLVDNAKKLIQLAATRATPDDINTHLAIAQWALENNEVAMARTSAQAASKIDPDSVQALLLLGLANRFEMKHPEAEKDFVAAMAKAPSNFAAINQLSLALIEQPDEAKRRRAMEYAQLNQRANPDTNTPAGRESAATLAWVLYRLGREADAERVVVQVLQSGSVSNESAFHAAQILHGRGRTKEAKQILEPLLKNPANFPGKGQAKDLLAKLANEGDLLP